MNKNEEKMLLRIKELENQLLEQEKQHTKELQSKNNQINNITYEYDQLKAKTLNKNGYILIEKQYVENLQAKNKTYDIELEKQRKLFNDYKVLENKIKRSFLKQVDEMSCIIKQLKEQIKQTEGNINIVN